MFKISKNNNSLIQDFITSFEAKYIFYIIMIPFGILLVSLIIGIYFKWFVLISKAILLLLYIGAMFYPIVVIYYYKKDITNPLISIFESTEIRHEIDKKYLDEFLTTSLEELEIAKIELEYSKNTIYRRIALLIGSIEKIGILPGLIAMVLGYAKFENELISNSLFFSSAIYIAFYIMGIYIHTNLQRMERYIHLIDHIIKKKLNE